MHPASLSMKAFGAFISLNGLGLLFAPSLVLSLVGGTPPTDVWVRVVGAIVTVLGSYYWVCSSAGAEAFMRVSVVGRFVFAALCVGLVLIVDAPPQLLIFAAVDVIGALWTARGLRTSR